MIGRDLKNWYTNRTASLDRNRWRVTSRAQSRSSSKFGPTILSIAFLSCLSIGAQLFAYFRRRIGKASKGWREAKEGGEPLAGEGKRP